jgi:hypothetical protein
MQSRENVVGNERAEGGALIDPELKQMAALVKTEPRRSAAARHKLRL